MYFIQRIDLLLFLVNIFLLLGATSTSALKLLRSGIEKAFDERGLQKIDSPPPNDECSGAIIIPSNFQGDSYTTPGVLIDAATNSSGGPNHECYIAGRNKYLWYKFKPTKTSYYSFSTNQGRAKIAMFIHPVSVACEDSQNIACNVIDEELLYANTQFSYLLLVRPWSNATGMLQLTVHRRQPPSNYLCTNATVIDPVGETFQTITDGRYGIPDLRGPNLGGKCSGHYMGGYTLWYKMINPLSIPLSVDVTVQFKTSGNVKNIGIIQANNCTKLRCVSGLVVQELFSTGTVSYDFIAAPGTSYYILLTILAAPDTFNVKINGQSQYFTVFDSKRKKALQLLRKNLDYYSLSSISWKLNIHASFTSPESIKSVLLTYDVPPKRIICDQEAPYSIFGKNTTIPLGHQRVTATPYSKPNCKGKAGTTAVQEFRVSGCDTYFPILLNSKKDEYIELRPFINDFLSSRPNKKHTKKPVMLSLPCQITLYANSDCGLQRFSSMRTDLRDMNNKNKLVVSVQQSVGDDGDLLAGLSYAVLENVHLAVGVYSIRTYIDDVPHQEMIFEVVNTTCDGK